MDHEELQERTTLVARMFALITAKLEDSAMLAADCQSPLPAERLRDQASKLQELLAETAVISDAAAALIL